MVVAQAGETRVVIPFQVAVQEGVEVGLHRKVLAVPSAVALLVFRDLV
jgi:hypothetical protein